VEFQVVSRAQIHPLALPMLEARELYLHAIRVQGLRQRYFRTAYDMAVYQDNEMDAAPE
jgi:hypothetical protein